MGSQRSLKIYIDPALLNAPNGPDLGNLTFARKVNGVANVIFQSKEPTAFSAGNILGWTEGYSIGAINTTSSTFTNGQPIQASTTIQPISPGFVCDWKPAGRVLLDMPAETPAPAEFTTSHPGMFGTINQPASWKNAVYCQLQDGTPQCIYADVNDIPGITDRGYLVDNQFQVSWEVDSASPGILFAQWTQPWPFSMGPNDSVKYISWGYASASHGPDDSPQWYNYNTTDPGKHDPTKQQPSDSDSLDDIKNPVDFQMTWGNSAPAKSAALVQKYLTQSNYGGLKISADQLGSVLKGHATFDTGASSLDLFAGDNYHQKVACMVQDLMVAMHPRYMPLKTQWSLDSKTDENNLITLVPSDVAVVSFFSRLSFEGVGRGVLSNAIFAAAGYIASTAQQKMRSTQNPPAPSAVVTPGQPVIINNYYNCTINVTGLPDGSASAAAAATTLGTVVNTENARTSTPPPAPNMPTPDPVKVVAPQFSYQLPDMTVSTVDVVSGTHEYNALYGQSS